MTHTSALPQGLVIGITASAFDAGVWRKDELVTFATQLGIPTRGTKAALSTRIRSQLGRVHPPTESIATSHPAAADASDTASALNTASASERVETMACVTPAPSQATAAPARAPDFFKEQAGKTRAQALSSWFASRSGRPR